MVKEHRRRLRNFEKDPKAKMTLSVCVITYNQEKYIARGLDSILAQKVDFQYEVVIGEDFSTDKTREIVLSYKRRYPKRFHLLLHSRNIGAMANQIETTKACRGKYIAMLEGDDYWTCPTKLQKQVDFLEKNPDFSITSHNVKVIEEEGSNSDVEWPGKNFKQVSILEDRLRDGSGGATCSLVFRKSACFPLPEWFRKMPGGDWSLQILCTARGKMKYFSQVMGVYQAGHVGNATDRAIKMAKESGNDPTGIAYKNTLRIVSALDRHFNYSYSTLLDNQRAYCFYNLALEYKKAGRQAQSLLYFVRAVAKMQYVNKERLFNYLRL